MATHHDTSIVASDEKIAQTLQEEFDSEAAMEAANVAIPTIDQLQVSTLRFVDNFPNFILYVITI